MLFPKGLLYDAKIEHYRTPIVNEAIACITDLSKGLEENKNGTFLNFEEKSRPVAKPGLEPGTSGL